VATDAFRIVVPRRRRCATTRKNRKKSARRLSSRRPSRKNNSAIPATTSTIVPISISTNTGRSSNTTRRMGIKRLKIGRGNFVDVEIDVLAVVLPGQLHEEVVVRRLGVVPDLTVVPERRFAKVQHLLNTRPRKRLGYRTPPRNPQFTTSLRLRLDITEFNPTSLTIRDYR
jgi:hypothetical protein